MASKSYSPQSDGFVGYYWDYDCEPSWYAHSGKPASSSLIAFNSATAPLGEGIGKSIRAWIQFKISADPIPSGSIITDITLRVNVGLVTANNVYVKSLENEATSYGLQGVEVITIVAAGQDYSLEDKIDPKQSEATGALFVITEVDGSGGVVAVQKISSGYGYRDHPFDSTITDGFGTGCFVETQVYPSSNYAGLFDDCGDGEDYYTMPDDTGTLTLSLDAASITDLNSHPDWFGVGIKGPEPSDGGYYNWYADSRLAYSAAAPLLTITYESSTRRRFICG